MLNRVKNIFIAVLLVPVCSVWSQNNRQTKDTINTEVVNVVKPYTPKISDAFKVKEIPTLDDRTTTTKKECIHQSKMLVSIFI